MVQLIPDFLPMKKIKIEIASQVNVKWISIPKLDGSDLFKEDDRFSSNDSFRKTDEEILTRSFFGLKTTMVKMDERIVKSALDILERRDQMELEVERARVKKICQDAIEQKLDQLLHRTQSQS
jgi:hypothetical protein